ncbi:MAG: hypothetical protein BAA01_03405 [Bacillus thermozeamaize]|uniref:RNA-binding protein n=1 Tax=Bacillus thermozeamaize TaxID=230954 RepID=A0A1Y3PVB2_9BACI|nr:MAG: hypothetical protein BAA01_03405 [Bacillus thermozeamaize]
MEEILIVDGYNCIHAWPHLSRLKEESLEEARSRLVEELSDYQAYRARRVILVFDAHQKEGPGTMEVLGEVEIVYTDQDESADRRIERLVRSLVRPDRHIYVATSDYTEQRVTFAQGALRISARELYHDLQATRQRMRQELANLQNKPATIGQRLPKEMGELFEKWRRGK